jgi:hypothetical protein
VYQSSYLKLCTIVRTTVLYTKRTDIQSMVSQAKVKLYGSKSRHSINLPSDFVRDSAFPFEVGEELIARIEGRTVIIEKKQT